MTEDQYASKSNFYSPNAGGQFSASQMSIKTKVKTIHVIPSISLIIALIGVSKRYE
jgi:hypothetical protein